MNILPAHRKHFRAFKGVYNRKQILRLFGSMSDDSDKTTSKLVSEERIKQGKYARENLMRSTSKPDFMTKKWNDDGNSDSN